MSENNLASLFNALLSSGRARTESATGDTPQDCLYGPAESVRRYISSHVYVTFRGKEYGPEREMWGALDGDKNKSTVLIQAEDGKYWKLWYFDNDVKK